MLLRVCLTFKKPTLFIVQTIIAKGAPLSLTQFLAIFSPLKMMRILFLSP